MALSKDSLRLKGNMSPRRAKALATAHADMVNDTELGEGMCLKNVRLWLEVAAEYPTAIAAFKGAGNLDQHSWYNPPAGVPVFWSGGSTGAGHVALADGLGNVYSTDILRKGKCDLVPIATIHARWGLTYQGWTETLNSVVVYLP